MMVIPSMQPAKRVKREADEERFTPIEDESSVVGGFLIAESDGSRFDNASDLPLINAGDTLTLHLTK